jgi:hypothetical protein
MSEVAAIVNSPGRAGVSREMRDAGAVGMSRAQGFLSSSPREEHLRVGPHQGDRLLRQLSLRRMTGQVDSPVSAAF